MSEAQQNKDNEAIYTLEVRKRMSDAHIGLKDTEETKENKRIAQHKINEKEKQNRLESGELKCNAPGCDKQGLIKYRFVDGVRYCQAHAFRLQRNGTFELLERTSPWKGKKMPEEVVAKLMGRIPVNKINFTKDQIKIIMDLSRSIKSLSREFKVTEKVIVRVRKENII